ncbi:MAG: hypothetical protein ACRENG_27820 [bacterium]
MKIYQGNGFLLLFTGLLPCLITCTSPPREQPNEKKDFTIIFGSGGGFTGFANGYVIHGDGRIEKWSGPYFRHDKIETFGTASSEALKPLRQRFSERAFAQWAYQDTGNMTTRVWCISGQDTTSVSWKGIEPGKEVPLPIQDLYRNLMQVIKSINQP